MTSSDEKPLTDASSPPEPGPAAQAEQAHLSAEEFGDHKTAPGDQDREQERLRQNVLSRMKRIEGQVRGIQKMIELGKECEDILVQVKAVRSALTAANALILKRYLLRCQARVMGHDAGDPQASMEKFIKVMAHFLEG